MKIRTREEMAEDIYELEAKVKRRDAELSEWKESYSELDIKHTAEKSGYEARINERNAEITALEKEVDRWKNSYTALEDEKDQKIKVYTQVMRRKDAELAEFRKGIEEREGDIAKRDKTIDKLEKHLHVARKDYAEARLARQEYAEELDEATEKVEALENTVRCQNTEIERLKKDLNALEGKRADYDLAIKDKSELLAVISALEENKALIEAEHDKASKALDKALADVEIHQGLVVRKNAEIKGLEDEVKELENRFEVKKKELDQVHHWHDVETKRADNLKVMLDKAEGAKTVMSNAVEANYERGRDAGYREATETMKGLFLPDVKQQLSALSDLVKSQGKRIVDLDQECVHIRTRLTTLEQGK